MLLIKSACTKQAQLYSQLTLTTPLAGKISRHYGIDALQETQELLDIVKKKFGCHVLRAEHHPAGK